MIECDSKTHIQVPCRHKNLRDSVTRLIKPILHFHVKENRQKFLYHFQLRENGHKNPSRAGPREGGLEIRSDTMRQGKYVHNKSEPYT